MKIKIPKFKIHLNLAQILLLILVIVLLLESFVLYNAFYASVASSEDITETEQGQQAPVAVKLDLVQYEKIKKWIEKNRSYVLPNYEFISSSTTASTTPNLYGRENPFAQ